MTKKKNPKPPARTSIIDVSALDKKRQEACVSCLECCKWLRFDCGIKDESQLKEMADWYLMRGCRVRAFLMSDKTWVLCVMVSQQCKHLAIGGCTVYKNRPDACARYDGLKDPMMKDICKWKDI